MAADLVAALVAALVVVVVVGTVAVALVVVTVAVAGLAVVTMVGKVVRSNNNASLLQYCLLVGRMLQQVGRGRKFERGIVPHQMLR